MSDLFLIIFAVLCGLIVVVTNEDNKQENQFLDKQYKARRKGEEEDE